MIHRSRASKLAKSFTVLWKCKVPPPKLTEIATLFFSFEIQHARIHLSRQTRKISPRSLWTFMLIQISSIKSSSSFTWITFWVFPIRLSLDVGNHIWIQGVSLLRSSLVMWNWMLFIVPETMRFVKTLMHVKVRCRFSEKTNKNIDEIFFKIRRWCIEIYVTRSRKIYWWSDSRSNTFNDLLSLEDSIFWFFSSTTRWMHFKFVFIGHVSDVANKFENTLIFVKLHLWMSLITWQDISACVFIKHLRLADCDEIIQDCAFQTKKEKSDPISMYAWVGRLYHRAPIVDIWIVNEESLLTVTSIDESWLVSKRWFRNDLNWHVKMQCAIFLNSKTWWRHDVQKSKRRCVSLRTVCRGMFNYSVIIMVVTNLSVSKILLSRFLKFNLHRTIQIVFRTESRATIS